MAERLFTMHDDGTTLTDLAAAFNRSGGRIRAFAAARGVLISRSLKYVQRALLLPLEREMALRRLALDYGATPRETLVHLAVSLLAEDAAIARQVLHVRRKEPA